MMNLIMLIMEVRERRGYRSEMVEKEAKEPKTCDYCLKFETQVSGPSVFYG